MRGEGGCEGGCEAWLTRGGGGQDPMNRLKSMGKTILDSEEGKECMRAYTAILASLQEYERQHREEWAHEIENTSAEKLKQSLLRRDPQTGFVFVNFDPALVCLLRETKYFLLMRLEIPDSAAAIFDKAEVYRQVCDLPPPWATVSKEICKCGAAWPLTIVAMDAFCSIPGISTSS